MPPTTAPDPLLALFTALAQAMQSQTALGQGRLALQRDTTFGRHLGAGGGEITGDNPLGYAGGSPFANGFFRNSAADMTPHNIAKSQGGNALNQWAWPGEFAWSLPPTTTMAEDAVAASPAPWMPSPPPVDTNFDPASLPLNARLNYEDRNRGARGPLGAQGPTGSPGPRPTPTPNPFSPRPGFGVGPFAPTPKPSPTPSTPKAKRKGRSYAF